MLTNFFFKNKTIFVPVGMDYLVEAEYFKEYLKNNFISKNKKYIVINFSLSFVSLLNLIPNVNYFRNFIEQSEELVLFDNAYKTIDDFIESLNKDYSNDCLKILCSALRHTWARDIYYFLCFEKIYKFVNPNTTKIFIMDLPYNSSELINVFKNKIEIFKFPNIYEYPYKEVIRAETDVIETRKKIFEDECQKLQTASVYNDLENKSAELLFFIEDSGTKINMTSGLKIISELQNKNISPLILTSQENNFNEIMTITSNSFLIQQEIPGDLYNQFTESLSILFDLFDYYKIKNNSILFSLFVLLNKPRLYMYLKNIYSLKSILDKIVLKKNVKAALFIGEGDFYNAAAIEYCNQRGIETIGVSPVLLMNHPTCFYWPAKNHLVYGKHIIEIMKKNNINDNSIYVVGSEHFDKCYRRNKINDVIKTKKYLGVLNKDNIKIVVIATEYRAREMTEIEPTVRTLAKMKNIITVIKLHPSDIKENYLQLINSLENNKNIYLIDKFDVLALINTCDLLITMGSNLIVEAAVMGKITLVYNFSGEKCPIDFVDEGLCVGINNVSDLEKTITDLLTDSELKKTALYKLTKINMFNGPNDGKSSERIADYAINFLYNK